MKKLVSAIALIALVFFLAGCVTPSVIPTPTPPQATPSPSPSPIPTVSTTSRIEVSYYSFGTACPPPYEGQRYFLYNNGSAVRRKENIGCNGSIDVFTARVSHADLEHLAKKILELNTPEMLEQNALRGECEGRGGGLTLSIDGEKLFFDVPCGVPGNNSTNPYYKYYHKFKDVTNLLDELFGVEHS